MQRSIPLIIEQVQNVWHKLARNQLVQFRGNLYRWLLPNAGNTVVIKAGHITQHFNCQPDIGRLDQVNQRTRAEQVMRKTPRFLVSDFFRPAAIMAEQDVTEFSRQSATDDESILL